ncbi:hypothetical protein NM688_g7192 [Phlebia brevispora]|uniref:Uncharacterized protein n=1 Tax=Phlebia brevispora TaxID=194682 RepID=A0ACC1S833_9APHY|nr:hypothetical protein NM688_g7192 [Phlebia brevispora]
MSDVTLIMTPNNPKNTIITLSNGPIAYKVDTMRSGRKVVTRVCDITDREIASLQWGITTDTVKFGDRDAVPMTEWMKKSSVPFKRYFSFTDDQERKYRWKGLSSSQCLELYAEDDNFETPICRFVDDRLTNGFGRPQNLEEARIVLTPRALQIQDLAIVSLLFLEKAKRTDDKTKPMDPDFLVLLNTNPLPGGLVNA